MYNATVITILFINWEALFSADNSQKVSIRAKYLIVLFGWQNVQYF